MNQITKSLSATEIAAFEAREAQALGGRQQTAQEASAPVATFKDAAGRAKSVELEWPLTIDGKSIDRIELRRLTGRDFRALATIPAGADENIALLALMTGLTESMIADLDADDYAHISEEARDFLPRGLREATAQTSTTGEVTPQ